MTLFIKSCIVDVRKILLEKSICTFVEILNLKNIECQPTIKLEIKICSD